MFDINRVTYDQSPSGNLLLASITILSILIFMLSITIFPCRD